MANPVETPQPVATAKCTLELPQGDLTVGQTFVLHCDQNVAGLKDLELRVAPEDKYAIQLLGYKKTETGMDLLVTSYQAGQHHIAKPIVGDAIQSFTLDDVDFQVKSVLPTPGSKEQVKQPEPYGPLGPVKLHLPWWYYALWVLPFVIVIVIGSVWWTRRRRRLQFLNEIENQFLGLPAYQQLGQFLRQWRRQIESAHTLPASFCATELVNMDKAMRIYAVRTFQAPIREGENDIFVRTFKKFSKELEPIAKQYVTESLALHKVAVNSTQDIARKDMEQILLLAQKLSDQVEILKYQRENPAGVR